MGTPQLAVPFTEDGLIPYCLPYFIKVIAGDDLKYIDPLNIGECVLIDTA